MSINKAAAVIKARKLLAKRASASNPFSVLVLYEDDPVPASKRGQFVVILSLSRR